MRRFWNRPLGSKLILVLSFALLLEMLAPWQRICAVTSGNEPRICGWRTGYEGTDFGLYAAILAAVILVWELLPVVIPKLSMRGWPTAVVTAILSVAVAVCVLVKLIKDNEFQTIWAWVGFAIALAIMLTALIRVRFRWESRHARARPEPSQGVPPPHAEPPPRPAAQERSSRIRSTIRKVARPTSAPRTAHSQKWTARITTVEQWRENDRRPVHRRTKCREEECRGRRQRAFVMWRGMES